MYIVQVMPGYQRAQQNWRRTSNLAARVSINRTSVPAPAPGVAARVSLNRLPAGPTPAPAPGAPALASLHAPAALVAHYHPVHLFNCVLVAATAQQGGVQPRSLPMMSDVRASTPIGRSRQRSRSMTSSPGALLEEYKTRWTCKVSFDHHHC